MWHLGIVLLQLQINESRQLLLMIAVSYKTALAKFCTNTYVDGCFKNIAFLIFYFLKCINLLKH